MLKCSAFVFWRVDGISGWEEGARAWLVLCTRLTLAGVGYCFEFQDGFVLQMLCGCRTKRRTSGPHQLMHLSGIGHIERTVERDPLMQYFCFLPFSTALE